MLEIPGVSVKGVGRSLKAHQPLELVALTGVYLVVNSQIFIKKMLSQTTMKYQLFCFDLNFSIRDL